MYAPNQTLTVRVLRVRAPPPSLPIYSIRHILVFYSIAHGWVTRRRQIQGGVRGV
jgi:hypothetical protein